MRKKKKLLNLALLLSLGVGSFGPNVSAVFAEELVDEIVLEGDESQTTEALNDNTGEEVELEIPDSEELSESIDLDAVESEEENQAATEMVTIGNDETENGSSNQPVFYSNADFEIKNGVLIKYRGNAEAVAIPSSVTSIGEGAFSKTNIVSVNIPDSVKSIGKSAFEECANLEKINIGNGVKEIPSRFAQRSKKLKTVVIGDQVTTIGEYAFYLSNSLSTINLPSNLNLIGQYAFAGTNLENIEIPDSVTSIGMSIFENCLSIQKITIGTGVIQIPNNFAYGCTMPLS